MFKGRTSQQRVDVIARCVSHVLFLLHYIRVQAAFLLGWLMFHSRSIMNLQALITTPLPSQFLAILYLWPLLCLCMCNCLILFWKNFTSLAGFYTILLICPDCYLSQFPVCAFHFGFSPVWKWWKKISFSWDALFFCSWKLLLKFLQTLLRMVFSLVICYSDSYLVAPFELLGITGPSEGLEVWLFSPGHTMDSDLSLKGQLRFREEVFFSFLKTMLLKIIFKWTLKCFANTSSLNPPSTSKEFRVRFTCFYIFLRSFPYLLSQTLGEQPSCLCLISPQIIPTLTQVWELPL